MANANAAPHAGPLLVFWRRMLQFIARAAGWMNRPAPSTPTVLDIDALSLERLRDLGFSDGRPARRRGMRD